MLLRVLLFRILRRKLSIKAAYKSTYLIFALFPVIGLVALGASGMPMYGFDNTNLAHQFGYFVLFLSPFGIPFFLGLPIVFIVDFIRRIWRSKGIDS